MNEEIFRLTIDLYNECHKLKDTDHTIVCYKNQIEDLSTKLGQAYIEKEVNEQEIQKIMNALKEIKIEEA